MTRFLLALSALAISTPAFPQTLIHNVNGIQVGRDGKLQRFGGLLIDGEGRVKQLIQRREDLNEPTKHEIDGQGRTLLPGLIDAHGHVMGLGQAALQLDLVGVKSIDDLKARLARHAAANPGSGWILGRGWNQELWPDKRMPSAADLDAVVADRPVWLGRVDGHASVANSAAMAAAAITSATPSPNGGQIEKDRSGNPTGLFIDTAEELVDAHIPPPSAADMDRALAEAQRLMLASGLTGVADMGTSVEGWNAMRRLGDQGRLKVRIMSYSGGIEPLLSIAGTAPTPWLYEDRLRMGGIKIYGDGALGSRGAWLKRPYADMPGTSGLAVTPPAELKALAARAAAGGFQVAIHAIGDRANEEVLTIFEGLGDGASRRWRVEHAQVVDPVDIARFAESGIIASMQPTHQVSDRTMAEARLGTHRLEGAYAWQTLAKAGVRLALGSDFPVEPVNPFLGLSAAVSRQDPTGVPQGGWRPAERLNFTQALAGFTRDAAYAGFAEDRIGSLEPGKWADFILIDRDPTKVDARSVARTRVLQTWIAGERVFSADASPAR